MNFWTILVPLCLMYASQVESRFVPKSWMKSDDEKPLPVPTTIPERLQKYCKADPESKFCVDLGLGKTKKLMKLADSVNDVAPEESIEEYDSDRSEESSEESDESEEKGGKIDCEETPEHPGCMRNNYLDQFIAWKIGKDCEVDPNGPFCPKTLAGGCANSSESSTASPESASQESSTTSSESPESSGTDTMEQVYTRMLNKILDEIRKDPTSSQSERFYPFVKVLMDRLKRLKNSESSPRTTTTTQAPSETTTSESPRATFPKPIGDLLRQIFGIVKNIESPKTTTVLRDLIRQILNSDGKLETVLSLLKDYWNQLKTEFEAQNVQKPEKYVPEVNQEVYIAQDSESHVDSGEDVKPIATFTGFIPSAPKSYLSFY